MQAMVYWNAKNRHLLLLMLLIRNFHFTWQYWKTENSNRKINFANFFKKIYLWLYNIYIFKHDHLSSTGKFLEILMFLL